MWRSWIRAPAEARVTGLAWLSSSRRTTLRPSSRRAAGRSIPDELLSHVSPAHSDNINFFGVINVGIEAELAKLTGGWRSLRPARLRDLGP